MKEPKPKPKPSSTKENTHPTSFASEQEKEKMVNKSEPMQQEAEAESELKTNSPLIEITKSPQYVGSKQLASFMPSSHQVSKIEPASQHHPSSPLASVQNEMLKANHEENTFYTSSTSQEQKEKIPVSLFEPVVERKRNSPSKIILVSQPESLSKQTKTSLDEERSISTTPPPKSPLETQRKFLQHKEKEKVMHESKKVTTDGEGNTNNAEDNSMEHSDVGKAYVNSNIQSINNSLMFHGSINERDPGVQVTLSQKPSETIKRDEKDTRNHKTEFNISRSQKLTF
ncbi:hypothetical protein TSUD_02830 [Trifolium subterraneum]|uniref:Uncharacterized protein n=1 Tax=Trifolium subterraneum TaxID=3900 RepID=A0A2Z6MT66_TRISU|nr:hypothetical protein TSUD_02830 [Trifolium subterraneum]